MKQSETMSVLIYLCSCCYFKADMESNSTATVTEAIIYSQLAPGFTVCSASSNLWSDITRNDWLIGTLPLEKTFNCICYHLIIVIIFIITTISYVRCTNCKWILVDAWPVRSWFLFVHSVHLLLGSHSVSDLQILFHFYITHFFSKLDLFLPRTNRKQIEICWIQL